MTDPRMLGSFSMIERHLGLLTKTFIRISDVMEWQALAALAGYEGLGDKQRERMLELERRLWGAKEEKS